LIPAVKNYFVFGSGTGYKPGADRTVDTVFASACTLTQINYPTGGDTRFTYESNRVPAAGVQYSSAFQVSGTQLRIFNIINSEFILHDGVYTDSFTVHQPIEQIHLTST